jgi:hypothetical protein
MVGGFGDEGGEGESSIMTEVDGLLSASRRKRKKSIENYDFRNENMKILWKLKKILFTVGGFLPAQHCYKN